MSKKNYHKLGVVLQGEYGPYVVLGNTRAKDEKYNYEVQVMLKKPGQEPKVLKNPLISLYDPRKSVKEGETRNIPDNLKYELTFVETTEE